MKRLTKYDYDTLATALRRYRDYYADSQKLTTGQVSQNYSDYLEELLELMMTRADFDNDLKNLYREPTK